MDRFHLYEKIYLSSQLTAAYEIPLRSTTDAAQELVRDRIPQALLNAARLGECNTTVLSELAVAFGMRKRRLTM